MRHLLLIILLFPLIATAQDKSAKRTCRIVFLNPPPGAPSKLFLFDGASTQEVELPKMNFSDVYQIATGNVNLRLLAAPVEKAEQIPEGAPLGKVAEGIEDFYIVASADVTNKVVPVKIQIIDAGSQKFRKGQMMWYNLTPYPIGGQIGSQQLALKSQSRAIIDAPATKDEPYDVNLSYTLPNDKNFHSICQTKWVHDTRSRKVLFVYGGANNSIPDFVGFSDFRPPVEKAQ